VKAKPKPEPEPPKVMMIAKPLVIMFGDGTPDGNIICHLHPPPKWSYREYGLLVADLIRHVAGCFKVSTSDVMEWVEKELGNPTAKIVRPS